MMRLHSLSSHFRQRFGHKVRKIPLDAGFSCPNRDGTTGLGGCLYCPPSGSGSGDFARGRTLTEQWCAHLARLTPKREKVLPLAYLQAFSNTHGPVEKLAAVLEEASALPDAAGLCLGTRPDCLDAEKLDLIASLALPVRLEIGLQSANPDTLTGINRGHGPEIFAAAARQAAARGLYVCAHVMAGLPGETADDFLATVDFVNALPVGGIKFHNTCVYAGSGLESWWRQGRYQPLSRDGYLSMLAAALARLRPDIVVERLNADPGRETLLAPDFAADKRGLLDAFHERLERDDIWQGKEYHGGSAPLDPPPGHGGSAPLDPPPGHGGSAPLDPPPGEMISPGPPRS